MKNQKKILLKNIDWWIIIIYFILITFGWINIYSVSQEKAEKQLFWILLSFFLIFFLFSISPNNYKNLSYIFYLFTILLLIGVLFFGKTINGSKSWYKFGFFSFQPSELSKISISLVLSKILSINNKYIKNKKVFLIAICILIVPSFLIVLQPDIGSILIFFSFILMFYREGMSLIIIKIIFFFIFLFLLTINFSVWIIIKCLLLLFLIYISFSSKKKIKYWIKDISLFIIICIFIFFSPIIFKKFFKKYQRERIEILFKNELIKKYRSSIGYNILYSKIAISSGKLFGRGFKKGIITKGKFVPEQHTDYIFCTVGEEWGFLGSLTILIIYLFFIGRIYFLAEKQTEIFSRIYGYCVASIFFLHIFINLSMIMGIIPTIGIPLPFFSYGGSSLWCFTTLLFIFLRISNLKS